MKRASDTNFLYLPSTIVTGDTVADWRSISRTPATVRAVTVTSCFCAPFPSPPAAFHCHMIARAVVSIDNFNDKHNRALYLMYHMYLIQRMHSGLTYLPLCHDTGPCDKLG